MVRLNLVICAALLSLPAFGSDTTYTQYETWAISAGKAPNVVIVSETFDNNQIQTPELTITTRSGMGSISEGGNGVIANNSWVDCVGKDGCNGLMYDVTTFNFSKPVYGLAGDWDMAAGSGLEIYAGGSAVSPNQYIDGSVLAGNPFNGFFGFVSDTPFYSIVFASSSGAQSFTLCGLSIAIDPPAPSPEPSTIALMGAACVVLGLIRKRFRR
jgi:hypothetical protein